MAYTEDDLAEVRRAILDLAAGKRVAKITYNGRTVEYSGSGDLDKLRQVERQILSYLSTKKRRSRTRHTRTAKGL